MGEVDLPGAAHLVLADGVVHLDPAEAVFEAMAEGWARQQRTRFLNVDGTIKPRLTLVRRFAEFTGEYPWRWRAEDVEAFIDQARSPCWPGSTTSHSGQGCSASLSGRRFRRSG